MKLAAVFFAAAALAGAAAHAGGTCPAGTVQMHDTSDNNVYYTFDCDTCPAGYMAATAPASDSKGTGTVTCSN
jgi:hypothetical protein